MYSSPIILRPHNYHCKAGIEGFGTRITMLPNKEDEKWHKAFYNDIRSNNIKNLENLISEWPHNLQELDEVLAKAYEELKLKNVLLENKTEIFIQNKLLDFRFFSGTSRHDQSVSDGDLSNTMERIELTVESIRLLKTDYSKTEKVDGKFIFLAKCIAKNIHILKHQLKSTHDGLPWEQMEFCLVIFISSYTKMEEMNLFYRCTLNKSRILNHIENFANKLEAQKGKLQTSKHEQEVMKIINSCPQFEELYKDNQQVREVQSLVKISDHIKSKVLKANPGKKDGQLIIAKALKLIGEHLKSTLEFSGSDRLLQFFQENTRKIIVDLHNSQLLAERIEKEKAENSNFLVDLHNDFKKVGDVINNIFDELTIVDHHELISLQGFKSYSSGQDQSSKGDKIEQIELLIQSINGFKVDCSNTEEVDERVIFGAKSLAQNISKLKRQLKPTYDRLHWEELEFCLGSFVTCYTKKQEMNPFYRAILNKFRILSHLENFAKKLEDEDPEGERVVEKKKSNLEFEELYRDYQQVRDFNSLKKMNDHIELALSDHHNERNGQLIITRVLQFIGEHLKNTPESPKFSDAISELLLLSLQGTARRIIIELRDLLSHDDNDSLSKRIEIEKRTEDNFFLNVKNDIKKVGDVITDILYNNQIDTIRTLLNQIVAGENSDEIKEIAELLTMVDFHEIAISDNFKLMEHEKLEDLVNELKDNILEKTDSEKEIFNQIDSEMKCARNRSRSQNLRSGYLKRYVTLKSLNDTLTLVKFEDDRINLIKTNAKMALKTITSNIEPRRWKKISDLSRQLFNTFCGRNPCNLDQVCNIVEEIHYTSEFGTGTIKWIENFREKLNEKCSFSPIKEERHTLGKISNVTEERYNNLLEVKLSELDKILVNNYCSSATEDLSVYKSDKETQAVVEMFLLDIMAILDNSKNYLENNLLFLDDYAPLINGKCLRNHLATAVE